MNYGLGIDTGGTYTDSVIIDMPTGKVICSNKALTTHNDLSAGIRNSLKGLDCTLFGSISLTSLSSTLATNSVVENKGCRVGLICIGTDYKGTLPEHYSKISGKFGFSGREEIPLDIDSAEQAISDLKGKVDAVAISGYISVRNPAHENTIAEMVKKSLGVPTACAHELTSQLGFEQRTTTAIMNARLIPIIDELIKSVKAVLEELGIESPLMIVKGNGALMKSEVAVNRPVETILSGPASSIMGARTLTDEKNAMIIDMGGTTSDIAILRNGFPQIDPEGAHIEGKRTRVIAADVSTYGIGGDSRIVVNGKKLILCNTHVIPLCIASETWPSIRETIASLAGITEDLSEENYPLEEIIQNTEFFTLGQCIHFEEFGKNDREFLKRIGEKPLRISDASAILGSAPHSFSISEMESRGCIIRIGITPTDILHADGTYSQYDIETSRIAIDFLARKCGKTPQQFIEHTKEQICCKIASKAMEKAIMGSSKLDSITQSDQDLIDRVLNKDNTDFTVGFRLNYPIIGVGAPVKTWLPRVSELLQTKLILPEHSEVGNAIGAITSSIRETVTISIRAEKDLVENPACNVFTGQEALTFPSPDKALKYARARGTEIATGNAVRSGTKNPVIDIREDMEFMELCETKKLFRGATVTVTATGKPDLT